MRDCLVIAIGGLQTFFGTWETHQLIASSLPKTTGPKVRRAVGGHSMRLTHPSIYRDNPMLGHGRTVFQCLPCTESESSFSPACIGIGPCTVPTKMPEPSACMRADGKIGIEIFALGVTLSSRTTIHADRFSIGPPSCIQTLAICSMNAFLSLRSTTFNSAWELFHRSTPSLRAE